MAKDFGYDDLSKKGESYEICFVPDNDYRGFLKRRVPELEARVAGGEFVDTQGKVLGNHDGYPFYTIGQRKGLGIAFGKPMFVTEIRPESNTVVLGEIDDLVRNGMRVGQTNWMKYSEINDGMEVLAKVRYRDNGTLATIHSSEALPNAVEVEFLAHVRGVAPGQSAVFYEGDDVLGGGVIYGGLNLS
jgi:tRNA-specific 2-thiouridylase